jgi:hypothetical protein
VRIEKLMPGGRWTAADYNRLEAAIANGSRVLVMRQGSELVVVPRQLRMRGGRESVEAIHPATGELISFNLDEIEHLEVV